MTDNILIAETAAGIMRLTLNRPHVMNTIDLELATALRGAAEAAAADPALRVVLLTGAGKMFSAGGDLRSIAAAQAEDPARLDRIVDNLHCALLAFARMDALLVVAANGAAGAGLSLLAGADYAIAGEAAKYTSAYTAAGLSPDAGLSWHLPRHLGVRRARTLMLSNRALSAAEALDLGLIDEIAPGDMLDAAAVAAAERFARGPKGAFAAVKRLTCGDLDAYAAHLERERQTIIARFASEEGREGLSAFAEKRPPRFGEGNGN